MTDLEAVILSIVQHSGPSHGFAIAQVAEERLGRRPGVGSLYKALHRMEQQGFLRAYWEERDTEPAHRGPKRRYYEISAAGLDAVVEHSANFARAFRLQVRPSE